MIIKPPETHQEYFKMIDDALAEVEDLRNILEYEDDADGMEAAWGILGDLERQLKQLATEVKEEKHKFADEDLPFMKLIAPQPAHVLPFKPFLLEINRIHRKGLGVARDA